MAEWGRKEYSKAWPSRTPVWTWVAILLSFVFFAGVLTVKYMNGWTAAQRLYLVTNGGDRREWHFAMRLFM
jgi:hypothetical protein